MRRPFSRPAPAKVDPEASTAVSTEPPADAGPPRQARAVATRERILEAAAADFAAVGYHGSSLSRILERSTGVTKGALYFHFASKEVMALAVVEGMSVEYRRLVERAAVRDAALDPLRRAAHLACAVQDVLSCSVVVRAGVRLAIEGAAGPSWAAWPVTFWQSTFTALFVEARERGDARREVDPEGMARFVLDISEGAFICSALTTGLTDLAQRVRHNWDLMLESMAEPHWLAGWREEGAMAALMRRHLAEVHVWDADGGG